MTNTANEIKKFLNDNGRNAKQITQGLAFLGNGSMESGLKQISNYFEKESIKSYNIGLNKGLLGGGAIALSLSAIVALLIKLITDKVKTDKVHKEEGERILNALKQGADLPAQDELQNNDENDKYKPSDIN